VLNYRHFRHSITFFHFGTIEEPVLAVRPARFLLAMGSGLLLAATPVTAVHAATDPSSTPVQESLAQTSYADGDYVVTLAQDPIASYDGSLPGLPQLKSATGDIDLGQATTQRYRDLLTRAQTKVAEAVGVEPLQRYTVALNGFSARLSAAQAEKLAATDGVLSVAPDVVRHLTSTGTSIDTSTDTSDVTVERAYRTTAGAQTLAATGTGGTTADYLGLTGDDGVWASLGGVQNAGKGVVVADLDTGLWPDHPSVAGNELSLRAQDPTGAYLDGSTITMDKADGGTYTGVCETGQDWTAADCSTKVVGARTFSEGYRETRDLGDEEFDSARDSDGHGTHTATTAVGLDGIPATIAGDSFGDVTGIAPAAALAVYKVCWTSSEGENGCQTSDLVAAIDQAVADNVDVINYSIGSGPTDDAADPIETAFLSAASAGVFVAASAGNSGPGESTTDHASPWVTTVAAGTSVLREGTIVLDNGQQLVGASLNQDRLSRKRLILGSDIPATGVSAEDARMCLAGSLNKAKAKGRVVVCERAVTARVDKSAEVARAGGVGMVLYNPEPNSVEPDAHAVPTIHLDTAAAEKLIAYVEKTAVYPWATFRPGNTTRTATATPQISAFSSRGPALVDDGDVLKPDLTAPGSGIVAGYSPVATRNGRDLFAPESGTSMSAPHVAGLAALYYGVHPEFTPMMVKSALMTTARSLVDADGRPVTGADATFGGGAGFVDPARMLEPGLVYDSTPLDWLRFLEGSGVPTGTGLGAVDPSDLNQASIAVADLVGKRTVRRSVTATTGGYYYATADVPGYDVQVSPSVLVMQPGETKQFSVTLTRTTADLQAWSSGSLTWTGGDELTVTSPIAVKALDLQAPVEVDADVEDGQVESAVTAGADGPIDVQVFGVAEGQAQADTIPVGFTTQYSIDVPVGTYFTRFDLTGAEGTDVDLYLFTAEGDLVSSSTSTSADERLDGSVDPGEYILVVDAYEALPGRDDIDYTLTTFLLNGNEGADLVTVTPDPLPGSAGRDAPWTAAWSDLDPGKQYLGMIQFGQEGLEGAGQTLLALN